ncbi:response regulator [Iningainema tapete]|uniref:histidine kinase n=1 Tax=Iningainema tapete BLCC-T55 TaxID=2748662 RepID=A0A8J7CHF3_9CYAN|nr:response regulator [Iningainema tapete]MBD2777570.1 response regulator [Iningainema tapete BLCC-T55]
MSGLRFLLLEDSPLDAELIHAQLTEGGISCIIVHVKTEQEFQAELEQCNFDLILSDYSLPSFNGITALAMARQMCPEIPFIFVTATMGEEVAIETLKSGATDYVLKQRMERLPSSVHRALREAEERRARKLAEAEIRRQKQELEQANRVKDEFLAVLSHELRSPLNAILGWSKLIRTRQLDSVTLNRALETIERNAKQQTQLIEDLLDISRIIRGKLSLTPQPTNLIPVIEAAIETMRLAAIAKSVDLEFRILGHEALGNGDTNSQSTIENSQFQVLGDANRLQQVIWNLLSNAIKFTPQGGKVEVLLSPTPSLPHSPSSAQLTVKDTGIGINPDFLPYVFDSFRQADGTTTRKHGGLGLGLAIVRHLVELHGGNVTAQSPGIGLGATFTVTIPLKAALTTKAEVTSAPVAPPTPLTPLQGVRILVVDDDADSLEFLVFALENYGALTTAVSSAREALSALASFQPDVLISDIGMPEADGYALIRQVRALSPTFGGIPAVALTAYAGDKNSFEALAAGFTLHLSKPVIPDELVQAIANLLNPDPRLI